MSRANNLGVSANSARCALVYPRAPRPSSASPQH